MNWNNNYIYNLQAFAKHHGLPVPAEEKETDRCRNCRSSNITPKELPDGKYICNHCGYIDDTDGR